MFTSIYFMGALILSIPMGGVLAVATMPVLALAIGWRRTFVISGAISFLSILLCLLFYREPHNEESHNNLQPIHFSSLWEIFKNRDLMVLSSLIIVFMGLQMSLQTYLILFCKDRLLYSVIAAGYFLSLAHLGGVVGRLFWGSNE